MTWEIRQGDWIERLREMPNESVHCVVCSPPYWGLRDYLLLPIVMGGDPKCQHDWTEHIQPAANGLVNNSMQGETLSGLSATRKPKRSNFCVSCGAWRGQLGLEPTPDLYIQHMVAGFREIRRVLRKDGTLWLNLGDTCASKPFYNGDTLDPKWAQAWNRGRNNGPNRQPLEGLKPKDLIGIPWMVAFALRADGWYLRSDIIWAKPNPMPESVTDRPTKAHEYVFLLSKSAKYFYDAEAIKEPVTGNAHARSAAASEFPAALLREGEARRRPGVNPKATIANQHARMGRERDPRHIDCAARNGREETRALRLKTPGKNSRIYQDRDPSHPSARKIKQNESFSEAVHQLVSSRNKRSVWEIATYPYPEAHFATFPPKLVEPCILAATSEKGCCPECGAPWERITEKPFVGNCNPGPGSNGKLKVNAQKDELKGAAYYERAAEVKTIGWHPTCKCGEVETQPCTVLDPFSGAGTTGLVAVRYHRNYIGIELNSEYLEMSCRRITEDAPLFNSLPPVETVQNSEPLPLIPMETNGHKD